MAALKIDPVKGGVVILALLDLALLYPLYSVFSTPPEVLEQMTAPPASPQPVKISASLDTADVDQEIPGPSPELLTWDPFRPVKGLGAAVAGPEEGTEAPPQTNLPIPTDNLVLHGIISLNGQYRALVSIEGAPSEEVRKGMTLPGTNITAAEIRADAVILSQPGSQNTPLRIERESIKAQPWYRAEETDSAAGVRGRIEMRR